MNEMYCILADGAAWRFLSLLFRCPSDRPLQSIKTLAEELPEALRSEAQAISSMLDDTNFEAAYHALLGSGGAVSPYESDYQGPGKEGFHDKGAVLGDVAGFYRAFGFNHAKEVLEAPDHVAVELAFLSFLNLKMAYASMDGNGAAYEICRDAEGKFLEDHLSGWISLFADRVLQYDVHEIYERAASMLVAFASGKARLSHTVG